MKLPNEFIGKIYILYQFSYLKLYNWGHTIGGIGHHPPQASLGETMIADYGYGYVTTSASTAASEAAAAASGHHGDPLQQAHNHFFPAKEDQEYYNGSIRISSRFEFYFRLQ